VLCDAEEGVAALGQQEDRKAWAHLGLPEDVRSRVLVHCNQARYPALEPAEVVFRRLRKHWDSTLESLDGDQFRSFLVNLQLAIGAAADGGPDDPIIFKLLQNASSWRAFLDQYRAADSYVELPPLAVSYAAVLTSVGAIDWALAILREILNAGMPGVVRRHVERELVWCIRGMRLQDLRIQEGVEGLSQWDDPEDRGLLMSLRTLWEGERRESLPDIPQQETDPDRTLLWLHAIWRTVPRRGDVPLVEQTRRWLLRSLKRNPGIRLAVLPIRTFAEASARLDLVEMSLLSDGGGFPLDVLGARGMPECISPDFDREAARLWASHNRQYPVEALTLLLRAIALDASREPDPPELEVLARQIGLRRAAATALDEGQLLRMRLPKHALPLLEYARRWFTACDDPLGIVRSSTLLALARGPNAVRLSGRDGLESVCSAYERMRNQLQKVQSARFPYQLLPSWDDLEQLAVTPHSENLGRLDGLGSWRPWLARLMTWIYGSGTSADAEGSVFYIWLLKRFALNTATGTRLPADYDGWFGSPHPITSEPIDRAYNPSEPDVPAGRQIILSLEPLHWEASARPSPGEVRPIVVAINTQGNFAWSTPGLAAYGEAPPPPRELIDRLRLLASPESPRLVEIRPSEGLHGPCWEALLTRALTGNLAAQGPVRFCRTLPVGSSANLSLLPPVGAIRSEIDPNRDWTLSNDGWAPLVQARGFRWQPGFAGSTPSDPPLIVHLVGTAVEDLSEVRFQTSPDQVLPKTLIASEIRSRFPTACLCVVQGAPRLVQSARTQTDRHDGMLARVFAAAVHDTKMPAVLVIPPLDLPLAGRALWECARAFAEQDLGKVETLLGAVYALREFILKVAGPEPAYDLCLYVSQDWKGLQTSASGGSS
jgi:hypothetical protein